MEIFGFSQKETGAECCYGNDIIGIIMFLLWCTFLVPSLKNTAPIFLEIFLIECCTVLATSFPGSLFSASLGRWKKDPGCGWSHDHPESGWQKNLLGGRGGRVFCLVDVTCERQILSKQSLNTARSFGVRSRICRWWMLHDFCRLQNIEDFRSQRNSAAEWSRNVLTISKCERSRTGSKWNQWISLLNLWIGR